jgi:CheY-like chemotaxis protein
MRDDEGAPLPKGEGIMSKQAQDPQDMPPESRSGPPGTVLVVDDNPDLLDITQAIIEGFTNFKVVKANTGKEALEIVSSQIIDVIILDDSMPEMSGQECFRTLRQRSVYVPVIFLTGCGTEKIRSEQMALGAFDYLDKPIKAKDLILLINDAYQTMERIRSMLVRRTS